MNELCLKGTFSLCSRSSLVMALPLFLCLSGQIQGRELETTKDPEAPTSLADAVEQALDRRLDIRMTEADQRYASARVRQARARFRPRVGLSVEFSNTRRWDDYAGISAEYDMPGVGRTHIDVTSESQRYQLQPVLEASYSLYSGGGDSASLRQAQATEQSAGYATRTASQRVILEVAGRYLDLRRSCAQWKSANAALTLAVDRNRLSEGRKKSGRLAEIELREDNLALMEKRQVLEQRSKQVASAHGRYVSAVNDLPSYASPGPDTACRFDRSIEEDLRMVTSVTAGMPKREKYALDIAAAREQVSVEKAARMPQVSLFARYGHIGRHDHSLNDLLSDTRRQEAVMGIRVSFDLYDGGLGRSRVDAAQVDLQRRQIEQERHVARVERYRQQSASRRHELKQALELAVARYELARSRRSLVEERFKSGQETAIARLESRHKEQEARTGLDLAELDQARAELDMHYAEVSSESTAN